MTLRQVASGVGFSEATLSNIETDKVAPNLDQLAKVAGALGVKLSALLPRSQVSHYLLKRGEMFKGEAPVARKLVGSERGPATHHNLVWSLADLYVGKHMDPTYVHVHPLADEDVFFIAHDHEEFMFVLSGNVETQLKTNDELVTLKLGAGDCLYFRSNLPHCHRSLDATPAETLFVMYSLRAPIDPFDGELDSSERNFYRRGVYADAGREAGEKIGLLRRSHGLTLSELAGELDLGSRTLADIEHGDRPPTVDLLMRLARRFRRPIEYFFSTTLESRPYYFLQRAADMARLPGQQPLFAGSRRMHEYMSLASGFSDPGMHPYYVRLENNVLSGRELIHHHGQQFVYVLDGEMEFVTGAEDRGTVVERLNPGDSIFFESSVPYALNGKSRNPYASAGAEILNVFWTPAGVPALFEEHPKSEDFAVAAGLGDSGRA